MTAAIVSLEAPYQNSFPNAKFLSPVGLIPLQGRLGGT
jgi:hypothetical protein